MSFNTLGINGYYFNGVHFFLDSNLLDFCFRVPLRSRHEQLYQKRACLTLNSKIANVPNQETGHSISGNLWEGLSGRVNEKLPRKTRFRKHALHKDSRIAIFQPFCSNYMGKNFENKIRVALVVSNLATGGLERSIARIINHLNDQHFESTVICFGDNTSAAGWITKRSTAIVSLNKRRGNDIAMIGRFANELSNRQIDIVHSHNWGTLVETTVARRRASVPVHIHAERGTIGGSIDGNGIRSKLRDLAMAWCLNRAEIVVSNAGSVANRLESRCGFPSGRVSVIPNGVESIRPNCFDETRNKIRGQLQLPPDSLLIGSVGRLHPVKSFGTAIDAVAALNSNSDTHLVLVGDGSELSSLRKRAAIKGISDRIHFVGMQTNVGEWLAAMDVYINTSISEGMSQSVVEAMSVGLPLVLTDVGDNGRLASGPPACGLIVEPNSPGQFADALQKLVSNTELRQSLGENARVSFRKYYEIQRMMHDYESLYMSLCSQDLMAQ